MSILYSVEAMISESEKNYKGELDFYRNKCVLHNSTKVLDEFVYDINEVKFIQGKTEISFLGLYTKEKLYIQVITKEKNSKKYVIDDDKIEKTMQKLKALSVSSSEFSINNQVSSAVDEAVIIVENYNDNAVKSLIDNPYRLLGIASNATIS